MQGLDLCIFIEKSIFMGQISTFVSINMIQLNVYTFIKKIVIGKKPIRNGPVAKHVWFKFNEH